MVSKKVFRVILASSVAVIGLIGGTASIAEAARVPAPRSCAKNRFAEWHDGYPTFFRFMDSRVAYAGSTLVSYNTYLVGYYTVRGPVPFGQVTKICPR
jgi:hypothetical protein